MKTLLTALAITIALTSALTAHPKDERIMQRSNSEHFNFSKYVNSRPSENKTSRDEAKAKMINTGQITITHFADTLVTWTYDEYLGDFVISDRKYYVYENGNAVEIITERPNESGYYLVGRESITYNSQNSITEKVLYFFDPDADMWRESQKFQFIYNDLGMIIKEIHSMWCSDIYDWEEYFKFNEEFTYDSNGNLTSIEAYYWSLILELDQYLPAYKEEFEYDELGRISTFVMSIPNGLEFELSQMEEYHYSGNDIMQEFVLLYNYEDGKWELDYKVADIIWYRFEDNMIESMTIYTDEHWDDWDDDWKSKAEWYEMSRLSFQFHPENDMRTMMMEEVFFFDYWLPVYKEIFELDENLYITRFEELHYWDSWEIDFGYDYKWKFNDNNEPIELMVMLYDSWDGDFWQYYKRYAFGYYTENESVGINNPISESTISIYPNPAKDIIHIFIDGSESFNAIAIYDISGKLVKTQQISKNTGNTTVNISELRQGLYFAKIHGSNESQVFKLLKQ